MMTHVRGGLAAAFSALFVLLSSSAFSANLVVPTMELITHASAGPGGILTLQTYGNLELGVQGGYKFGGSLTLGLQNSSLEDLPIPGALGLDFLSASISIRNVFSAPLSFTYFVGRGDTFGSGDGFALFGAAPIMTAYRGFLYFPTGPLYDGIYRVQGTGARVEWIPRVESLSLDLYVYEDTHSPPFTALGAYSTDIRFLLNAPAMKLEGFLGGTLDSSTMDYFFRGGVLFYAVSGKLEFLAQLGIPVWDPVLDPLPNINLVYLLVEPRLRLGILSIVPTFFWHPGSYMQASNPTELGTFDVNLNLTLGDFTKIPFEGGIEGNFRFQSATGVFAVRGSPWIGFATPGVLWTVKLNAKLWPFSVSDMFDAFVGVRAEF
jgi:hypothetical protein